MIPRKEVREVEKWDREGAAANKMVGNHANYHCEQMELNCPGETLEGSLEQVL